MGGPTIAFSPAQQIIAAMITPVLLILASGSLVATVLVRIGRIMDRVRRLADLPGPPDTEELARQECRALLAQRALTLFFSGIVCFVLSGVSIALDHATGDRLWWLPVGITLVGMLFLVCGSAMMLAESQMGVAQISAEISKARKQK